MYTEKESATKWCSRGHMHPVDWEDVRSTPKCAGSECMMWRWDQRSKHDGGYPGSPTPKEQWTGYCGLGGKP